MDIVLNDSCRKTFDVDNFETFYNYEMKISADHMVDLQTTYGEKFPEILGREVLTKIKSATPHLIFSNYNFHESFGRVDSRRFRS